MTPRDALQHCLLLLLAPTVENPAAIRAYDAAARRAHGLQTKATDVAPLLRLPYNTGDPLFSSRPPVHLRACSISSNTGAEQLGFQCGMERGRRRTFPLGRWSQTRRRPYAGSYADCREIACLVVPLVFLLRHVQPGGVLSIAPVSVRLLFLLMLMQFRL